MAKGQYRGVNNVARRIVKEYRGVSNIARKVKKVYRGVSNVARLVFEDFSLKAEYMGGHSALSVSYTVEDGGRTLKWEVINSSNNIVSAWFRIDHDGGFPSELTVSRTVKQSGYIATLICDATGRCINNYGNYANAFDYHGSTDGEYVDLETTYDDGTTDEYLLLGLNPQHKGTFSGEIRDLIINGELVEFIA